MPIDIPGTGISGFLHEAPTDGKAYGRQNESWSPVVEDAPANSTGYFRRNEQWVVDPLQQDAVNDGKTIQELTVIGLKVQFNKTHQTMVLLM